VDVVLYQVGNPVPLAKLATVSAADKQFTWDVPADSQLLKQGNVFISVDGSGVPHEAPKMASNMGANSEAFVVSTPLPKIEDTPEYKAQKEKEDKEKAEKEAKEQKEQEEKDAKEAEEKAKQEEEEAKKREEELKKKQRTQSKNSGASSNQVAVSAAVLCAMVAILPFF
jgi:outer membrane biosynthesis protein TonB